MKISYEKYEMLLESGRAIIDKRFGDGVGNPAVVLADDGSELPSISPNCFMYVGCGEDCVFIVDESLAPQAAW